MAGKKPPLVGSTIGATAFNSGNTYPSTYDALGASARQRARQVRGAAGPSSFPRANPRGSALFFRGSERRLSNMTGAIKPLVVVLAAAATLGASSDKEVAYPAGFRSWTHVSSAYIGEGNPAFPRFGGIHHIYANDRALVGYRTGIFPIGSVLVFDLHDVTVGKGAIDPTTRKFLDVMEKRPGGWRFVEFAGSSRTEISVTGAKGVTACAACHTHAKRDHVFSQFAE